MAPIIKVSRVDFRKTRQSEASLKPGYVETWIEVMADIENWCRENSPRAVWRHLFPGARFWGQDHKL